MKTLKNALIATLVAFTMVSLSYADGFKENPKFKKVVVLTFEQAIKDPGLVKAMHLQLYREDFTDAQQNYFIAIVLYKGNTCRITGTHDQWMHFFSLNDKIRSKTKIEGDRAD